MCGNHAAASHSPAPLSLLTTQLQRDGLPAARLLTAPACPPTHSCSDALEYGQYDSNGGLDYHLPIEGSGETCWLC